MKTSLLKTVPKPRPDFILPGILQMVAEAAGIEAARKLAAAKGGVRCYFPADVAPDHWLAKLIGHAEAQSVAHAFADNHMASLWHVVPMALEFSRAQRWRTIKKMDTDGKSRAEIAQAVGLHYKTIQRITNGKRKTIDHAIRQTDLFDL